VKLDLALRAVQRSERRLAEQLLGARIATTLVNAMAQNGARYGLQTMCEAGGLANVMVLEAV
jgi:diphthamide synthase (EF-2-diphthine--ammonia ligase)